MYYFLSKLEGEERELAEATSEILVEEGVLTESGLLTKDGLKMLEEDGVLIDTRVGWLGNVILKWGDEL